MFFSSFFSSSMFPLEENSEHEFLVREYDVFVCWSDQLHRNLLRRAEFRLDCVSSPLPPTALVLPFLALGIPTTVYQYDLRSYASVWCRAVSPEWWTYQNDLNERSICPSWWAPAVRSYLLELFFRLDGRILSVHTVRCDWRSDQHWGYPNLWWIKVETGCMQQNAMIILPGCDIGGKQYGHLKWFEFR